MAAIVGSKSLPPGFRFHPTDEELVVFYLKRKVLGKSLGSQMMSEVDVYQSAPWELPAKAFLKNRDLNWYFLCPRLKKYPDRGRSNRATIHGYWKSTGIDRTVNFKNRPVGKIKTLIFHRGKAPKGDRTDWVMHEYRLEDRMLLEQGVAQDSYVICKIYEKSGLGPKNGENYGAPFLEEEWDSDIDDNLETDGGLLNPEGCTAAANLVLLPPIPLPAQIQQPLLVDVYHSPNGSGITTTLGRHISVGLTPPSTAQQQACAPMEVLLPPIEMEYDEMDWLLAMFTEDYNIHVPEEKIFNGLEDLAGGSSVSKERLDWSQYLFDDCYIALDDLN